MKIIYASICLLISTTVHAGTPCTDKVRTTDTMVTALNFSGTIIEKLNKMDPEGQGIYLIGRVGQDLSSYKQKYSHGGFAYKDGDNWQITHELNGCGSDSSSIYNEGVVNFYLDDLYQYESKIVAFNPAINKALLAIMRDKNQLVKMHGIKYNMLAYPFSSKYQNSNGFLIETIALADAHTKNIELTDRDAAQNYLKILGYKPAIVEVGAFTRLGARMTKANIAFDDQPFEQRMAGVIQTVTFDGLIDFLKDKNISGAVIDVR